MSSTANTDNYTDVGGASNFTYPVQVGYDCWWPYGWPVCKPEEKKTVLTIEGTPEEVADLIRHFACRLKITIESMGEDN